MPAQGVVVRPLSDVGRELVSIRDQLILQEMGFCADSLNKVISILYRKGPITSLPLNSRALKVLEKAKINTIEDLVQASITRISTIRGMGQVTLLHIVDVLKQVGIY